MRDGSLSSHSHPTETIYMAIINFTLLLSKKGGEPAKEHVAFWFSKEDGPPLDQVFELEFARFEFDHQASLRGCELSID